jgi:hypothetical protein
VNDYIIDFKNIEVINEIHSEVNEKELQSEASEEEIPQDEISEEELNLL